MAQAVHRFFDERDFTYVHTPVITASDCEGAGEMFRVTTLDPLADSAQKPDCGGASATASPQDFFNKPTYLTVSGQLEGEAFATALSNIYTFGPTFRAENSNTTRHANEFWMIEPEMAFCDLAGDMDLAEEFVKYLITDTLNNNEGDLEIFNKFIDKGLIDRLQHVAEKQFQRVSYTEAVDILIKSGKTFEYPVVWGVNLQSEHERYLTEEHFKCPTTVYDYPKDVKPFYMRANDPDTEGRTTVTAMDLLVPGIGEIVGGAQREERLDVLQSNMAEHNLSQEDYWWYTDLRKYGTCPHAGFVMFATGMKNIRDVIPFARTPGSCEF